MAGIMKPTVRNIANRIPRRGEGWKRLPRLALVLVWLLPLGCGYSLVGTGSALPRYVKSIAVPVFTNTSQEPVIQRELTNAIRQAFINDHRLNVVEVKQAQLLMRGNLANYELRPVAFNARDVAVEYWVLMDVDVKVTDRVKKKPYFKHRFQTKWNYISPQNVVNSEEARQEALRQAFRDLANRLVSRVIDDF